MAASVELSDEQVLQARELWATGLSLTDIADEVGCRVDQLSPWLYTETIEWPDSFGSAAV